MGKDNGRKNVSKKKQGEENSRQSNISFNKNKKGQPKEKVNGGVLVYSKPLTVSELAESIGLTPSDIIKYLFLGGKMVTINTTLDDELIGQVCLEFGYDFKRFSKQLHCYCRFSRHNQRHRIFRRSAHKSTGCGNG